MTAVLEQRAPHPLRDARFARLWVSGLLTEIGRWILQLALPLYVLALTRSALVTAVAAMLGLLPSLIAAPLAGSLVDRFEQRRFLVAVGVAQAVALVPLLWVRDEGDLWMIYLVAAAEAVLTVASEAVKNVALTTFVGPGRLVDANAAISLDASLGRLVGSPLGGLLLSFAGLPVVLVSSMASFVVAAVLAWTIPRPARAKVAGAERDGFWSGLARSLRAIRDVRTLRGTFSCVAVLAVAQGMFVVLFMLFVTDLLGLSDTEAGLLRGVQAVGGFLGTATVALLARKLRTSRLLAVGIMVFAAISAITWNLSVTSLGLPVYVLLFTIAGIPAVWLASAWLALVEKAAPRDLRGRVIACVFGMSDGLQAVGMLIAGLLTGAVATLVALDVQVALLLLAGLITFRMLPGRRRRRRR